ncbi:MAG: type II toxin-antitoxin system Phd/YefM family antitoxin, partial [Candidatus Aminicenantes bacterium]|nr:type II toxin-antitoxin system Phd/YefM family antitoxin [Candidatus Aminicenantes bacterium]
MKATVLDLRRRMKDILNSLKRNEPVTLLRRGKVVGTI